MLVQDFVNEQVDKRWKAQDYLDGVFIVQQELKDTRVDWIMNFDPGMDQNNVKHCNNCVIIKDLSTK